MSRKGVAALYASAFPPAAHAHGVGISWLFGPPVIGGAVLGLVMGAMCSWRGWRPPTVILATIAVTWVAVGAHAFISEMAVKDPSSDPWRVAFLVPMTYWIIGAVPFGLAFWWGSTLGGGSRTPEE